MLQQCEFGHLPSWWQANKAVAALPVIYEESPNADVTSSSIAEHLKEGLTAESVHRGNHNGDALAAIAGAAKKVEAVYATPFLSDALPEQAKVKGGDHE